MLAVTKRRISSPRRRLSVTPVILGTANGTGRIILPVRDAGPYVGLSWEGSL